MKPAVRLILTFCCMALTASAPAQEAASLVRGRLLADTSAIEPAKSFRLGVHLSIEPSWHVYWKHPGQTGLPTTVELELPEGFTASEVQYPLPSRFVQPGEIEGFGYEDEVMLIVDVTPPAQVSADKVHVAARVRFLVCEKVCIPGQLDLDINLPVGASTTPTHEKIFTDWSSRLPEPVEPLEITGRLEEEIESECSVNIPIDPAAGRFEVFPQTPAALEAGDWSVRAAGGFATVGFKARLLRGIKISSDSFAILLAYTDAQGQRRGVSFNVPLVTPPPEQ